MRLLVLTHTFPPSHSANAKRPYHIVRRFLDVGWEVDVFTGASGMKPGAPESIHHPALRIFRTSDPVIWLLNKADERNGLFRTGALAVNGLLWPDPHVLWAVRTLRACRRRTAYDRVLVFVTPASLLLSGLGHRLIGRHCVFDYQESVTPYYRSHPRRSPLQRLLVPLLAKLERQTLHKAGRVIFTADTNRRAYVQQRLVKDGATAHVPAFFDAAVFREPRLADAVSPEFQVVYFGVFDWRGYRSPQTFLQSLALFLRRRPEARAYTRFLFYGNWLPEHDALLEDLSLRDVAQIQPAVPYEQYLEALKRSPILLLVASSAHNLFMPSKTADYFGAGRPIIAFVPKESEIRQILEQAGMADYACEEFDVTAGVVALERLWQRYRAGGLAPQTDKTRFWSSETQLPRYLDLVENCAPSQ